MNIEFEITLRCNAVCNSCSRHCHYGMYYEDSDVTVEQTERFAEEVENHGKIGIIHVMGGEPTIHPRLMDIVDILKKKLLNQNHIRGIQIVTNGIIEIPEIEGIGKCISRPQDKSDLHRCQFIAPYDTGQEMKECTVPKDCGVSFGAYGWWPCGAGGAIARLFGMLEYNRSFIPEDIDNFPETFTLCRLCQASAKQYMYVKDFGNIKSISFQKAFENFDVNKLWRY